MIRAEGGAKNRPNKPLAGVEISGDEENSEISGTGSDWLDRSEVFNAFGMTAEDVLQNYERSTNGDEGRPAGRLENRLESGEILSEND